MEALDERDALALAPASRAEHRNNRESGADAGGRATEIQHSLEKGLISARTLAAVVLWRGALTKATRRGHVFTIDWEAFP